MTKYRAKRQTIDGYNFESIAEARRYGDLILLQRAKQIVGLAVHPMYVLQVNGITVGKYTPDFGYRERDKEVKGYRTKDYIFRAKVFRACYPQIELREIAA